MHGLIAILLIVLWLGASVFIAQWIGKTMSSPRLRVVVTALLIPLLFVAPLADEIIGKFQFDKLCKEAEEIKIYGTMPVGEELYTADGRWRLGIRPSSLEELNRVENVYKSLVRNESVGPTQVEAVIPIRTYEHRIYNKRADQLLASYRSYGTSGGWLSRYSSEVPLLVRDQCFPPGWGMDLTRRILPFQKPTGG